ncbi:uncharacterized protein RJT20DRAFT_58569 [Scheffersomyces xylosifermentans]|uniref:uncharacterized protein n=1 Tax=Scheffersomyces xylosifermentans TaxID=1304137 RepID=UPI00315CE5CC
MTSIIKLQTSGGTKASTTTSTYTELPAQAFLARLTNRPALGALNGLLSSFPVIKIFTSNAVPIMVYREKKRREAAAKL